MVFCNATVFVSVTERVLDTQEKPWEIVKQLGKDSIRQMELMRFYLQFKQDPHGPNLGLFVGNLPPNRSQRNYEKVLTDLLGNGKSSPNSNAIRSSVSSKLFLGVPRQRKRSKFLEMLAIIERERESQNVLKRSAKESQSARFSTPIERFFIPP